MTSHASAAANWSSFIRSKRKPIGGMRTMIDTTKVKAAADALWRAQEALTKAKNDLKAVRGHCGQNGYAVTVNGIRVDVSAMDPYDYNGKLIRGREMIHLGAMKALQANIDFRAQDLAKREADLIAATQEQT